MAAAICRSRRAGRTDGDTETGGKKDRERWMRDRDREREKKKGQGGEEPDEPAKLIMESYFWPYLT